MSILFPPPSATFISFDHRNENYIQATHKIENYLKWLGDHGHRRCVDWEWATADRFAGGIFIVDPKVAVMFKLAFAT